MNTKLISNKKTEQLKAVTRDLSIWLNLKLVLHLGSFCKSEDKAKFNPKSYCNGRL